MGSGPAMASWADLDEDKRAANRAQVRDIDDKLRLIGCFVEASGGAAGFVFSSVELERLARREHERWIAQRTAAGWAYGEVRDDARRRHPDLVPWEDLDESARDKDRDAVRNIPAVLAAAGLRVVRGK